MKSDYDMIEAAKYKAITDGIEFIGVVNKSKKDGFAIVQGVSDAYKVKYKWDDEHEQMYGYSCSCPHNTYRDLPCKHMFKVADELEDFIVVK